MHGANAAYAPQKPTMPRPCSAAYAIEPALLLLPAPGTRTAGLQDHGKNHGNQYPNHEGNPKSPDCIKSTGMVIWRQKRTRSQRQPSSLVALREAVGRAIRVLEPQPRDEHGIGIKLAAPQVLQQLAPLVEHRFKAPAGAARRRGSTGSETACESAPGLGTPYWAVLLRPAYWGQPTGVAEHRAD